MNEQQKDLYQKHLALVMKYGQHFNLTTITDPEQMWTHHVLDSVAIAPYLEGEVFVDMGTGAGFPGIPLAIALPDKQFILVDSNHKKIHFLKMVAAELGLKNVQAIHARVEDVELFINRDNQIVEGGSRKDEIRGKVRRKTGVYRDVNEDFEERFNKEDRFSRQPLLVDGLISRAVGDINTMCSQSKHLLKPNGHFYWMKGQYPTAELSKLSLPFSVQPLTIPELKETCRHLVIIEND